MLCTHVGHHTVSNVQEGREPTLVVCKTLDSRGKSFTPASRVAIDESRRERVSRREETQPWREWAIVTLSYSVRSNCKLMLLCSIRVLDLVMAVVHYVRATLGLACQDLMMLQPSSLRRYKEASKNIYASETELDLHTQSSTANNTSTMPSPFGKRWPVPVGECN